MPRAEPGTPKYLANKMKSKGLQKLRWYCQMCQKQCRDENGFKCHTTSESHQRQLLLFAENSNRMLDEFSSEFCKGFLQLLKHTRGCKRVAANKVYQEYIRDKHHLHMNATRWHTLSGFVRYLGKTGKCVVEETEKGWFITYIDRDPDTIAKQEAQAKKKKMDKDDEERMQEFIEKQVAEGKTRDKAKEEYTELKRKNEEEKIELDMKIQAKKPKTEIFVKPIGVPVKSSSVIKREKEKEKDNKRLSALDEIQMEEERKREKQNRKDYWLCEGIVVKAIAKEVGEKYYKKKGVVETMESNYVGRVRFLDTHDLVKLDQAHVETVIPSEGRLVRIVNGAYRGEKATMKALHPEEFCAKLEVASGPLKGRVLQKVQYEDFSKLYVEEKE